MVNISPISHFGTILVPIERRSSIANNTSCDVGDSQETSALHPRVSHVDVALGSGI